MMPVRVLVFGITAFAVGDLAIARQSEHCSLQQFRLEIEDTKNAISKANASTGNRPTTGQVPCDERSTTDSHLIRDGLVDALKDLVTGNVPDMFVTMFKVTATPSQIGTSSELCPVYGLYPAERRAAERVDSLFRTISNSGCGVTLEFQLEVIEAIAPHGN